MLNMEQEKALKKLIDIERGLPTGVSLTFAVDNLVENMEKSEYHVLLKSINTLIAEDYLAKHTEKQTKNKIPFWLEITKRGREYSRLNKLVTNM